MVPFNLLAFVPFAVLLGTACIAAMISAWISFARAGAPRRAKLQHDATILHFPAPAPRRRAAYRLRQPAQFG